MVNDYKSPDMVRFDEVISVITENSKSFRDEKGMAQIIGMINSLKKYDLHSTPDNITNNNTTINLVAESPKVKQLIEKIKENV